MNNFQKYWSYFSRIVVERQSSEFNPELIVAIQSGKYVLNAKNSNYSYASLHRVFQQALYKIDAANKDFKSVLVLGCGAGSIPSIIYKELNLSPEMDAVEIDQKVIDLGNEYFGLGDYPRLNVVVDDANNFIKNASKKYDLILVDLFLGINVPDQFLGQHFFEQLKSKLNENGEVLLNYVAYNYDTKEQVKEIEEVLERVFQERTTFRVEGINRVFHLKA